jgi:hypothetical protein
MPTQARVEKCLHQVLAPGLGSQLVICYLGFCRGNQTPSGHTQVRWSYKSCKQVEPSKVEELLALAELQLDNVVLQHRHLNQLKAQGLLKS